MGLSLSVREAPKNIPGREPYRRLFPLGVAIGMVGVGLWILHAVGWIGYPGTAHASLLLLGFQQCFILGFLMTAMPSFLHATHCRGEELAAAIFLVGAASTSALMGWSAAAALFHLGSLGVPVWMAARRIAGGEAGPPPEEFILVGAGFATGMAGAIWMAGAAAGFWVEPYPRFGLRLIGFGMILPVVLGIGGLLVPTFMAMREPLTIPGLARAHERWPRRILYLLIVLLLVGAVALEGRRQPLAAAWVRAGIGSVLLLWVWKLFRLPGRADRLSYSLWSAGWLLFTGLWLGVLVPERPLLGEHVIFLGGFGFLTLGIATRVVVRHGGHPLHLESRVIGTAALALLGLALLVRALSEGLDPAGATKTWFLAGAAAAWMTAWARWAWKAMPLTLRRSAPTMKGTSADLLFVFAGADERKHFAVGGWRAGPVGTLVVSVARFEWRRVSQLGLPGDGGLTELVEATPPAERLFFLIVEGQSVEARRVRKRRWGTWSEALAIAALVRERGAKSLLICTSGDHLPRALLATRRAFAAGGVSSCTIAGIASPERADSPFAPARRWCSPRAWRRLLLEGFKWVVYALGVPMVVDPPAAP